MTARPLPLTSHRSPLTAHRSPTPLTLSAHPCRQVACAWVRENPSVWEQWLRKTERQTTADMSWVLYSFSVVVVFASIWLCSPLCYSTVLKYPSECSTPELQTRQSAAEIWESYAPEAHSAHACIYALTCMRMHVTHALTCMRMHHLVRPGGSPSAAWTLLFACAQCTHGSVQCVVHVPRDGLPAVQSALTCMHMWYRWAMYPGMGHRLYNMLKGGDIRTGGAKSTGDLSLLKRIQRDVSNRFPPGCLNRSRLSMRRRRVAKAKAGTSQVDLQLDATGAMPHSSRFAPAVLGAMTAVLPDIPAAEPAAELAPEPAAEPAAEGDFGQQQHPLSQLQQQQRPSSSKKVHGCPCRWPCCT